jgi:cathepsin B
LKRLAGVKPDIQRVYAKDPAIQSDFIPDFFSKISDKDIPKEFDSRKKWPECSNHISKIFDQSLCGSCWAVSSSTALSDRFCIASKGRIQTDLSVSQLISCCTECGIGCIGGYPIKAYAYIQEEGIVSGGNYTNPSGCLSYPFPPCK